jgi:DNA-directed RNA polymerase specialized sigma24 family protein
MSAVTRILNALWQGDPHAVEQLLPLVYDELRKLAALKLEQAAETMGLPRSTACVHWAYAKASLRVLLDFDPDRLPS